jgi:hypothetical protein
VTETPDGPYEAEAEMEDVDEGPDVPDLSGEIDNEPADGEEYPEVEVQDPEGTEVPEVNKHTDEEA